MAAISACLPFEGAPAQVRLRVVDRRLNAPAMKLSSDYCYAVNVTGSHPALSGSGPAGSCSSGAGHLGKTAGLYKVGDTAEVEVPVGAQRRFDLLAFPRAGDCSGKVEFTQLSAGRFQAKLNDALLPGEARVAATVTADIVPGPQTIELAKQVSAASPAGAAIACAGVLRVDSVASEAGGVFRIKGAGLAAASRVELADLDVPFSIVSKAADEIVAKAGSSIQFTLGQLYRLVVADAAGQSAQMTVSFTLAPGSVTPQHLAAGAVWPFPQVSAVEPSVGQLTLHANATLSDWASAFDRNASTFATLVVPSTNTLNPTSANAPATTGGKIILSVDLGQATAGTVVANLRLQPTGPNDLSCTVYASMDAVNPYGGQSLGSGYTPYDVASYVPADFLFRQGFYSRYLNFTCSNYASSGTASIEIKELKILRDLP